MQRGNQGKTKNILRGEGLNLMKILQSFFDITFIIIVLALSFASGQGQKQSSSKPESKLETEIRYLSGTGKDDAVMWDFYCTGGRRSGVWTKIPVPSNWEQQ